MQDLFIVSKVPLCMVDLAQTIEEWKDLQSVKVDDQVFNGVFDHRAIPWIL